MTEEKKPLPEEVVSAVVWLSEQDDDNAIMCRAIMTYLSVQNDAMAKAIRECLAEAKITGEVYLDRLAKFV